MKDITRKFILEVLEEGYNKTHAIVLHLKHQFDLPEKHRVTELSEDELENTIRDLKDVIYQYNDAIVTLKMINPDEPNTIQKSE